MSGGMDAGADAFVLKRGIATDLLAAGLEVLAVTDMRDQ